MGEGDYLKADRTANPAPGTVSIAKRSIIGPRANRNAQDKMVNRRQAASDQGIGPVKAVIVAAEDEPPPLVRGSNQGKGPVLSVRLLLGLAVGP